MEHEECSSDKAAEGHGVIPMEFFAKVVDGEDAKDTEGDDLLDDFELGGSEGTGADPVRGNLETVLEECNAPAHQDDLPKRNIPELEVTVPGKGHKDVRPDEQKNRPHRSNLQKVYCQ
jgi:hypothetical protein